MSGHSKWSQIRRQKGANDVKKGQIYTKIAKQIAMAVKQSGADPNLNFSLKMAIGKAKSVNMPSDSIEKAIKKALGDDKNASIIETVTYEAYGFAGATLLVDALTDNRNRTAADVRLVIEKHGGRLVEAGGISWQYETLGLITMTSESEAEKKTRLNKKWNDVIEVRKIPTDKATLEEFEIQVIDLEGVIDFSSELEDNLYVISIYTQLDKLDAVRKGIEALGYDVEQAEIIKRATTEVELSDADKEKNQHLIEMIEENEDVDAIWTNIKGL